MRTFFGSKNSRVSEKGLVCQFQPYWCEGNFLCRLTYKLQSYLEQCGSTHPSLFQKKKKTHPSQYSFGWVEDLLVDDTSEVTSPRLVMIFLVGKLWLIVGASKFIRICIVLNLLK